MSEQVCLDPVSGICESDFICLTGGAGAGAEDDAGHRVLPLRDQLHFKLERA